MHKLGRNWLNGHLSNIISWAFPSLWLASYLCSPTYSLFLPYVCIGFPGLHPQPCVPSRSTRLHLLVLCKRAYPFAHKHRATAFLWQLGSSCWNSDQGKVLTDAFLIGIGKLQWLPASSLMTISWGLFSVAVRLMCKKAGFTLNGWMDGWMCVGPWATNINSRGISYYRPGFLLKTKISALNKPHHFLVPVKQDTERKAKTWCFYRNPWSLMFANKWKQCWRSAYLPTFKVLNSFKRWVLKVVTSGMTLYCWKYSISYLEQCGSFPLDHSSPIWQSPSCG